jgi:O-antigen ligase
MTDHQTIVILGMLIVGVLAVAGLFRPFFGLLVLITIYFVQPAELFPALEPFHVERTYAISLLAAFWLQRESTSERPVLNPILRAGITLVGVAALSVPTAIWKGGALQATINLAKLVIYLFLLSTLIDTRDRIRKVLWLMAAMLAWVAGNGFLSYLRGEFVFTQGIERAVGETSLVGGPNELAGIVMTLLPLVLALWRCSEKIVARLFLLALMLLASATVVVTGSRAALIGLALIALYYLFNSKHKVASLLLCVVAGAVVWLAMPQQYQNRYLTTVHFAQGENLDASNEFRVHYWKVGWRMFLDHPILGVGAGQFSTASGMVYSRGKHSGWMNPHGLFFQVASELGFVGLVAVGYFLFQLAKANYFLLRFHSEKPEGLDYQLALAYGADLLGIAFLSTFGHTLYRPFWYFTGGLLAASCELARTSSTNEENALGGKDLEPENGAEKLELSWAEPFEGGRH